MIERFFGLWELKKWSVLSISEDLHIYKPKSISGQLLYSPDGLMSVSIFDRLEQDIKLITTYGGPYWLKDNIIYHDAKLGYSPDGMQSMKARSFILDEYKLSLETPPFSIGQAWYKHSLYWEKFLYSQNNSLENNSLQVADQ